MAGTVFPKAPQTAVLAVNRLQLDEVYGRGPTILVFFDGAGSEFWRQRLAAFQEKLPEYRSQNVQVLGVSVDDAAVTAKLADDVGVTFPLVVDKGGRLSKKFGLFDARSSRSAKAVALVDNGRVVYTKKVATTEVPARIAPWVERVLTR